MSEVVCTDATTLGIGTGTGMSGIVGIDAVTLGIGTGTGMSALTCADAAAIDRTPKINVVIVFFFICCRFLLQVVTRLLRAKNSKNRGPEFKCTRWFGRAKGEGCESDSGSFKRIVLRFLGEQY